MGIGPGDEVITAPLSAAFSALAVMMAGATPVFADIDRDRLTMDPDATLAAVTSRTAAIMPVHLYGQSADMPALMRVAERHSLAMVEDACQAHFASCAGRPVGTFGMAGAYSFYPTKNLAALGDAGAVTTSDAALAEKIKRLRNGGQSRKYHHVEFGVNSRFDEIQAAILRARLPFVRRWTERRQVLAASYRRALAGSSVRVPPECDRGHVYHLFPVLTPRRDDFQQHLQARGIGTLVHYPAALTQQPALSAYAGSGCPVAESVAAEVVSLPLHPALTNSESDEVARAVHDWRP
jgi:dTDP-4-amino-4,6-dideoxygalactose transaminase